MKEYSNKDIKVLWDPEKCIHAGECVRGLPKVFDRQSTPWINMQGAGSEEIKKVIDRCPSGALTYESAGKGDQKGVNEPIARIKVTKNGPLLVEGKCVLCSHDGHEMKPGGTYALCRCGGSEKKPFCDGTHQKIGFDDSK
jgi:uncharacterized Fe-S cluster protein YjdI